MQKLLIGTIVIMATQLALASTQVSCKISADEIITEKDENGLLSVHGGDKMLVVESFKVELKENTNIKNSFYGHRDLYYKVLRAPELENQKVFIVKTTKDKADITLNVNLATYADNKFTGFMGLGVVTKKNEMIDSQTEISDFKSNRNISSWIQIQDLNFFGTVRLDCKQ